MPKATTKHFLKHQKARNAERRSLAERCDYAAKSLLKDLFDQQRWFVLDPYKRKSLLCPRRAGKTHTAVTYALHTALTNPGCVVPLITLTLRSAKVLYWPPLRAFNEKYALGGEIRIGDNMFVLPNGSRISLHGADSLSDIERLRGGSYKLAIVDECKSIRDDIFRELITEVLAPATNDASGTIAVTGTPGRFLEGLFFESTAPDFKDDLGFPVTRDFYEPEEFWTDPPKKAYFDGKPPEPKWNRHHWTVAENIFKPEIWENACAEKQRERYSDDNPKWIREYLGQWVSTSDTMVYSLAHLIRTDGGMDKCRALWARGSGEKYNKWGLPCPYGDDWQFVMGADLGFNDHFAIVVMAYSPTNNTLYHVYEFKRGHLIVPQMAQAIMSAHEHFEGRISATVADTGGLGKLVVETLNVQHGLMIEAAEKSEKFDHIELFNSDLHEGLLKVLLHSELQKEMVKLQWDFRGLDRKRAIRAGKLREDPTAENHLCDAALYTWRYAFHHFGRAPNPGPEPGTNEWYDDWDNAEAADAAKQKDFLSQPYTSVALNDMLALNKLFN